MLRVAVIALTCVPAMVVLAGDAPTLRHNPFDRPQLGEPLGARRAAQRATEQRLRATLIDGRNALANIDGKLLAVGDAVDDATITDIGEGIVTLRRGSDTYTLQLISDDTDDDDGD